MRLSDAEMLRLVTDLRFRANFLRERFKEVPPQILETMERAATALEKCSNHESPPQG